MEGWREPCLPEERGSLLDPGPLGRITTVEGLLFEKAGPGPEVHHTKLTFEGRQMPCCAPCSQRPPVCPNQRQMPGNCTKPVKTWRSQVSYRASASPEARGGLGSRPTRGRGFLRTAQRQHHLSRALRQSPGTEGGQTLHTPDS